MYHSERERQEGLLAQRLEERQALRVERKKLEEQERLDQEDREKKRIEEIVARRKEAKEHYELAEQAIFRKQRPFFKGGFSLPPVEEYNPVDQRRKAELEKIDVVGQDAMGRQLQELLMKIDGLDSRIKRDIRSLKHG
mmetsp:Transcript_3720/g.5616  ORF Transcript_3720/g.5616 Transcript_3720/m.5616 type:complete len:138 (+) Transcript_3720:8038-8451(+)